jgi:hypothetical protein
MARTRNCERIERSGACVRAPARHRASAEGDTKVPSKCRQPRSLAALLRADVQLPVRKLCCIAAAAREPVRVTGKSGGQSEPGAGAGDKDGGQDKRAGTGPAAKPVCTWVWRGTPPRRGGAVPERDAESRRRWLRASSNALRGTASRGTSWPRVTTTASTSSLHRRRPGMASVRDALCRRY